MSATGEIKNLKRASLAEAKDASFPVFDGNHSLIGHLVPIGEWVFDHMDIVEKICNWRQKAMRFYLSQFNSSVERTEAYLRQLSILEPGRVLFLIFSDDESIIGHIGVKDVDGRTGGVDNAMRGRAGGHTQLVYFCEQTILKWCFETLQLSLVHLEVLSYNAMSIELHEQFGFTTESTSSLHKDNHSGEIVHRSVPPSDANVDYTCNRMTLTRERFISSTV